MQWRRQRGSSPLWVDVQKLCNMCVCFHCHGTSSYHTTNTKPYKFPMHCSKRVSFWGTSYSRPPMDPYLTPPPVTISWRRHCVVLRTQGPARRPDVAYHRCTRSSCLAFVIVNNTFLPSRVRRFRILAASNRRESDIYPPPPSPAPWLVGVEFNAPLDTV